MTVKGLSSLQRKLAALKTEVKDEIARAMEISAQEIVDFAQRLVPVDDMTLYESIGWTWGEAPKGSIALATGRKPGSGLKITIYAGNDEAFYARWVEFGTAPHNVAAGGGTKAGQRQLRRGGGLGHPGSAARPFFFPAYRANRKRTRSRITRAINSAARKQAGRS